MPVKLLSPGLEKEGLKPTRTLTPINLPNDVVPEIARVIDAAKIKAPATFYTATIECISPVFGPIAFCVHLASPDAEPTLNLRTNNPNKKGIWALQEAIPIPHNKDPRQRSIDLNGAISKLLASQVIPQEAVRTETTGNQDLTDEIRSRVLQKQLAADPKTKLLP